ncbi:hypothetical protein EP7_000970 [Isosphaeraceae bacterium EP7]
MIHPPNGLRASRPAGKSPGTVRAIYAEVIDPAALGPLQIRRASRLEPDDAGPWTADRGPILVPFILRGEAIRAEVARLSTHRIGAGG